MAIPYRSRMHPLMAAAAVSSTLVSVLGIAALTGVLPWIPMSSANKQSVATVPAPSPSVMPTALWQSEVPLSAADSLAPGEILIANDSVMASHVAAEKPAPVAIAKTPAPVEFVPIHPEAIVATSAGLASGPARTPPAVHNRQASEAIVASRQTVQDRLRGGVAVPVTTSGNSSNGNTDSGAALRSSSRTIDTLATNDVQRYSDVRSGPRTTPSITPTGTPRITASITASATPRITPVYRPDTPVDPLPAMPYQDRQVPRPAHRVGELAAAPDQTSEEHNRSYTSRDRDGTAGRSTAASGGAELDDNSGTALGRTISFAIDKTISVISDVLDGRYVSPPPVEPRDSIYR